VFDGGIEKEFTNTVSVREISERIGADLDKGQSIGVSRLIGNDFLVPYNKILYIQEIKE
jgi:hypothetical protein